MRLSEQQLINAVCEHMAERKQTRPELVNVELQWDEQYGYSAEVTVDGRTQVLVEANLIEAVMRYVYHHFNIRVYREDVSLDIDDEMYVELRV
ncbi:DUF2653 family protein [Paenibacillus thermoaerophilus]|uniref:DUF2653 family protein n=1 Tax=Paenibacillus thermoaerophilus TaxID=1215385 RepID=A0ABW2V6H4_9BACL|nr:DUF2653 family protein [Paenibacillus thermoaerophilus]TMV17098.1 DUF2653 family protein [Paenibacillus thermoaerophilus]